MEKTTEVTVTPQTGRPQDEVTLQSLMTRLQEMEKKLEAIETKLSTPLIH